MTDRLRLSLDVSAVPERPVGAGRYTINLARALAERSEVDLHLWARREDRERWIKLGARGRAGVVYPVVPNKRPIRLVWEQVQLGRAIGWVGVDVHHGPHYTMPHRSPVPVVVTVHDMTFIDHPEWHEKKKVPFFRRAIRVAAKRADAVICVSELTASRFLEACRPQARVFVVPHGVDHERFWPLGDRGDDHAAAGLLARLGAIPPYIVFLGTLEPRKGVADLVAAFNRLARSRPELRLVLAGGQGWGTQELQSAISSSPFASRIVRLGYVDDELVPALLRGAKAVAYPAKQEGFGLPALEALACGVPLVTTSGTAMSELAGDAAFLVPPGSPAELADALAEAIGGGPSVALRRQAGIERAARFTWSASAQGHLDAYRFALGL